MLLVGRHLTSVIEEKNQAEAALRSTACHLRETREGSVMRNTVFQHHRDLRSRLGTVIACWRDLCMQLIRTTVVGHVNFLLAPVLAWILCAPKYLTGVMGLGEVVQVAAAFVTVQGALNWFVDNYHRLADWVSSVNRVSSLLLALDQVDAQDRTLISATIVRVEPHQPMRQAAVVPYHVPLYDYISDEVSGSPRLGASVAARTPIELNIRLAAVSARPKAVAITAATKLAGTDHSENLSASPRVRHAVWVSRGNAWIPERTAGVAAGRLVSS
jgi:hypothetical protein